MVVNAYAGVSAYAYIHIFTYNTSPVCVFTHSLRHTHHTCAYSRLISLPLNILATNVHPGFNTATTTDNAASTSWACTNSSMSCKPVTVVCRVVLVWWLSCRGGCVVLMQCWYAAVFVVQKFDCNAPNVQLLPITMHPPSYAQQRHPHVAPHPTPHIPSGAPSHTTKSALWPSK